VLTSFCYAENINDLAKENAKLRERVDTLEQEMSQLKALVLSNNQAGGGQAAGTGAAPLKLSDEDFNRLASMVRTNADGKKPVLSSLDLQLYGYIKVDASYDNSRTNTGNFVTWVDSEVGNRDDNEFNMTAKQTRLGMNITGPDDGNIKTSGKVEVDFYGSGGTENKGKIQMRHAYMKIDWPDRDFNIIAGQTSDVISPLNPSTLNYTVLWDSGNIGYRRPQIRLTKGFDLDDERHLEAAVAITRTIGDNRFMGTTTGNAESGEDAGIPTVQGRVGLTFPWLDYKPTTLGVSGHWGKEHYDSVNKDRETWSFNVDLNQPINEKLSIKAEGFVGENLDTYFGGIGQGLNTANGEVIGTRGGWIAASLGPWEKLRYNAGIGLEDVNNGDVAAGQRTLNRSIFGNVIYAINKNTDVGLEISQWHTERKSQGGADALRAQMSFIYKF
jgi:DcaP outer membrane protein